MTHKRGWWTPAAAAVLVLVAPAGMARAQETAQAVSLSRAINIALTNSPALDAAEFGLRAAGQQVREAWGTLLPDVTASATYQRNLKLQQIFLPARFLDPSAPEGAVTPITVGSDNNWGAALTASQKLFEVSAFIGVGAAGRFKGLQEEIVRGTAQQVVANVRLAYFDALLADEQLRLTEQSIARITRTLEETRARHAAGLASEYDVLRFEVQLANLAANVEAERNQVAAARRRLLLEMGLDLATPIVLEGRLNEVNLVDMAANAGPQLEILTLAGAADAAERPDDELIEVAHRRRSDLRQLRSTVSLEEARLGVERAEFFPKLSLFSNYNVAAQEDGSPNFFGEGPTSRVTTAAAGLRVDVPVFRGFSRMARVAQAEATVRQQEARLARAELLARQEVTTLAASVREARRRAEARRRTVEQARRGFEIATAEYREGVGSQLQVADAEVALAEAEVGYARAVYDYLAARAQLDLALGLTPERAGAVASTVDRR